MSISKMQGISAYITKLKLGENDKYRSKYKCSYYDNKNRICKCYGSGYYDNDCSYVKRCTYYKEGTKKIIGKRKAEKIEKEIEEWSEAWKKAGCGVSRGILYESDIRELKKMFPNGNWKPKKKKRKKKCVEKETRYFKQFEFKSEILDIGSKYDSFETKKRKKDFIEKNSPKKKNKNESPSKTKKNKKSKKKITNSSPVIIIKDVKNNINTKENIRRIKENEEIIEGDIVKVKNISIGETLKYRAIAHDTSNHCEISRICIGKKMGYSFKHDGEIHRIVSATRMD